MIGRRVAAASIVVAAVLAVSGCAVAGAERDVRTTVESFFAALEHSDASAALDLTTLQPTDFACPELAWTPPSDGPLQNPEVTSVEAEGDTARAEVSYRSPSDGTMQLDLVRQSGRWRITPPDSWRIVVDFDAPTVAQVTIGDSCTLPATHGRVQGFGWPGRYTVTVVDPTNVLDRGDSHPYQVPTGSPNGGLFADGGVLPAVPQSSLARVRQDAAQPLRAAVLRCSESGFTDPSCPAPLRGLSAAPGAPAPTGDYAVIQRIWTDDDATWRFEGGTGRVTALRDGVATEVEFAVTGALRVGADGELSPSVD